MLGLLRDTRAELAEAALRRESGAFKQRHARAWRATLGAYGSPVEAKLSADGWLSLEAASPVEADQGTPPERLRGGGALEVLSWNGLLPGGARFALTAANQFRVRAEIPLHSVPEAHVPETVARALRGFRSAFHLLETGEAPARQEVRTDPGELRRRCEEANFDLVERGGGLVLQMPGGEGRGVIPGGIRIDLEGGCRFCAEAAPEGLFETAECRQAAGVFALTLGGAIRLARPAGGFEGGESTLVFETCPGSPPASASMVLEAVAALELAVRRGRAVLNAFENETVAREYLAARGLSPNPDPGSRDKARRNKESEIQTNKNTKNKPKKNEKERNRNHD